MDSLHGSLAGLYPGLRVNLRTPDEAQAAAGWDGCRSRLVESFQDVSLAGLRAQALPEM